MMSKSHLVCNTASMCPIVGLYMFSRKHPSDILPAAISAVDRLTGHVLPHTGLTSMLGIVVIGCMLYLFGTLLPDVDNRKSALGRFIYIPVGHRTFTHSIWPVLGLFVASIRFWPMFWLGLGYFLHLVWDSFSACGVCWFWPFSRYRAYPGGAKVKAHRVLPGLYHAGEISEIIFTVVVCVVCVGVGALLWLV